MSKIQLYDKQLCLPSWRNSSGYLSFQSHHPLQHKLAVIRTLLERSDSIVTEEEDRRQEEEEHTRTALHTYGYPDLAIKKIKEQMNRKKAIRKDKSKIDKAQEKSRGVVTAPYVHSFREKIQRIFTKHGVATVVKPQTTLRQVLVHPKDKVEKQKKAGVVYKIPCSQCEKVYIGETGRQLGTRITEHRKEAEKISDRNFTRSTRRASTNEHHKSAITDHVCQNNHIMNWEASEIVEQESDKFKRWIKESICIRSNTPIMNMDKWSLAPHQGRGLVYRVTLRVYRNSQNLQKPI